MEKIKKTFHEQIAENLIEQLKKGTAPWQKPWQPGDPLLTLPNNPTTGKNYKGINVLQLMCQGRTDPRWLTYKQAVNFGAQVRKGEKSTLVQHWKFADERIKKDDNGNPVLDSEGRQIKEQVKLERPRVFYASVFNAEQIDNLPKLEIKAPDWEPLDRAEQILQQSNAVIHHGENDRAFYRPSTDSIHLPHKQGTFKQTSLKSHRILRKFTDDKALRRSSTSQFCHEKLVFFWEIKKWFKAAPAVVL